MATERQSGDASADATTHQPQTGAPGGTTPAAPQDAEAPRLAYSARRVPHRITDWASI